MQLALISDIHEHLPDIKNVDMAIFCGDFCFRPRGDLLGEATVWYNWLGPYFEELRRRNILLVGCPGNHDFIFEQDGFDKQIRKSFDLFKHEGAGKLADFNFMFMSYCKLEEWAMYKDEYELEDICNYYGKYRSLKEYDFLITHTGPHDILSCEDWGIKSIGDLAKAIKPKHFHAFGHIHSRFGMVEKDGITYVNCYYTKEDYSSRNQYVTYDTETRKFDLIECENL